MAYANGKIYALRTHKGDEVYIGSTIRPLSERFWSHKNIKQNGTTSKSLFEKYDDVYIELIELFPCETKAQLNRREGEIMLGFGNKIVNRCIAGLTKKEGDAKYRAKYKETCLEKQAKYRDENCDKIKEYREVNREKINANQREQWAKNRAELNAKQREYRAKKKAETSQSFSQSGCQTSFSVIIIVG